MLDCQGRRVIQVVVTASDQEQYVEHSQIENGVIDLQVHVNFKVKALVQGDESVPECLKNGELPVTGSVLSRKKPRT